MKSVFNEEMVTTSDSCIRDIRSALDKLRESICEYTIVAQLEKIMRTHFLEMYSFYCKYFYKFKSDTCTVLVTRRNSVLASWFLIFSNQELRNNIEYNFEINANEWITIINKTTGKKNFIINDKYILSAEFENFISTNDGISFVILDDICIHGRAINEVKDYISKKLLISKNSRKVWFDNQIKTAVYMLSKQSQMSDIDEYFVELKNESWMPLSKSLVETIHFLNVPYVSYLNSYIYTDVRNYIDIIGCLKENKDLCYINFSSEKQKSLGQNSYLIFEKDMRKLKNEVFCCIRLYFNERTHMLSIVPFVMLEQLSRENIMCTIKSYFNGDKKTVIDDLFVNENNSNGFLYELLTGIASNVYGYYFLEKYFSEDLFNAERLEDCFFALHLTFGKKLKDIVTNMSYFNSRKDMLEKLASSVKVISNEHHSMDRYLFECDADVENVLREKWINDEINACSKRAKTQSVLLDDLIYNNVDKQENLNWVKIASIFQYCDTGTAYITACESDEKVYNAFDVGELGANLMHELDRADKDIFSKLYMLFNYSDYYKHILG